MKVKGSGDEGQVPRLLTSLGTVNGPLPGQGETIGTARYWYVQINTTDTTVRHGCGHVPNGYTVTRKSVAGIVYDATDGTARWTDATAVLRASVAGIFGIRWE